MFLNLMVTTCPATSQATTFHDMNRKNSRVLLVTYDYPYGKGEAFLESEIPILNKSFESIYILPCRRLFRKVEDDMRDLPANVKVLLPFRYGPSLLKHVFFNIFGLLKAYQQAQRDIQIRRSNLLEFRQSVRKFMRVARWAFVAHEAERLIENLPPMIGYAYWKSGCAYPIAKLAQKGKLVASVARAHHHDLYPNLSPDGYNPFDPYLVKFLDRVFSISEDGKRVLQQIGYSEEQILISRLGVRRSDLMNPGSNDGKLRIVSVSRVERIKRVDLIAKALRHCPPELQIEWTHFGSGTLLEEVRMHVSMLPDNVSVELRGEVSNATVLNHYSTQPVDLLLNVSESEGVPVSIMEALSFGVPCMATDVGATREIIGSANGYLLDSDPRELEIMETVLKLTSNREQFSRLKAAALETWATKFDRECNFNAFVLDLQNLIKTVPAKL